MASEYLQEMLSKARAAEEHRTMVFSPRLAKKLTHMLINYFIKKPEDTLEIGEKMTYEAEYGDGVKAILQLSGCGFFPGKDNTPLVESYLEKNGKIVATETKKDPDKFWGNYSFEFDGKKYSLDVRETEKDDFFILDRFRQHPERNSLSNSSETWDVIAYPG